MIVRQVEPTDLHPIVDLIEEFLKEGVDKYGFGFDRASCEESFFIWCNNKHTITLCLEHEGEVVGVLAGVTSPHFYNVRSWYFFEHIWCVKKKYRDRGHGLRLFQEAVRICQERGIEHLVFANQNHFLGDKFDKVYKRLGFEPMEQIWIRKVPSA